jgi:hypothetical protein
MLPWNVVVKCCREIKKRRNEEMLNSVKTNRAEDCRQRSRPLWVTIVAIACLGLVACDRPAPVNESAAVGGAGDSSEPVWFVEQAAARGITFQHQSSGKGADGPLMFPDIVGGGVTLADIDGDGDLDAYLVQSGVLDETARADAPANQLYFNRGDGTFELAAAPGPAADRGYGMSAAAGDYDNDGDVDLYVTNLGPNRLLRNNGQGQFEEVSAVAGVDHDGFGTAAAFVDLDRDGDLDLFLVNYVDWDPSIEKDCFMGGVRTYCLPTNYASPGMDVLYRNNGDGSFTDITRQAGIDLAYGRHAAQFRASRPGLGIVSADFNQDGLLDIFVANDLMVDQLWINQGDLRFEDQANLWGCDLDEHGIAKGGMGVGAGDIDGDADMDLLVVNAMSQTDSFYRNEGHYFTDITSMIGLGTLSRRYTRFGVALQDFDNDGLLDLYHANGAIATFEPRGDDPYAEPNVLYRLTSEGRFEVVGSSGGTATSLLHTSRGLAWGDVDNDGGLDLLIVNRDAAPYLLMNRVPARGGWIRFDVVNRHGRSDHGAVVSLVAGNSTLHRSVQVAASYLASNDPRVHFGLGESRQALEVRVAWVSGRVEWFGRFDAGQTVVLNEGTGKSSP